MYQNIIRELFHEAFSQQTLVALIRAEMTEVNQKNLLKWTRKYGQYMENHVKREKRKHAELEKMARAQLPTSEAYLQQFSEELDTQLPSKISRIQEQMELRDSNISVKPGSTRTELIQSTQQWFSYHNTNNSTTTSL